MARFDGTVVLVTGSSGIAAATARRIAAEGGMVAVVGLASREVDDLVAELQSAGHAALGVAADLRDDVSTQAAFAACLAEFGRLDAVVAVAGGSGRRFGDGAIADMTMEAWQATLDQNLTPVMTTARGAIQAMRPAGGSLVIVSSVLATSPAPPRFETHAYAAAKGAALALARSLAASYAPDGIRVNAVLPGATATPMAARAADDPEILNYLARKQPLAAGLLDPADVAAAIAFLASPEARMITGQLIAVDGGWSVTDTA